MTGMICRMDKSGLSYQTQRLARMIKPEAIMLINSKSFNGNSQYPEKYKNSAGHIHVIDGFPTDEQVRHFLEYVDVVISCETFYNNNFTRIARELHKKTILIANYEFMDNLKYPSLTLPDKIIMPSHWHMYEMKQRFNATYLPTPIFKDEFKEARKINLKRKGKTRFLFLNGKTAAHDRNGLESLYEALHHAKGDFEIVVKAQGEVKKHPDPRLSYDFSNPDEQWKLYADFDAMIMPRRYGGQCLPMTEALQSALPVIMTDIEPNNKILRTEWLVPATKTGEFMARTTIDIYSASPLYLANLLDAWATGDLETQKRQALEIGKQYDAETLRPQYEELLNA